VLTGAGACGAVLVLEDGIPIRPVGSCNVNELFEVNLEQAAAIEVLRGPGSVLYGSSAVHGVINVIPPMPAERTPLGLAYSKLLRDWDGTHTAPFSCHHAFARTDSRWAADYETPLEAHGNYFKRERGEFIPGYFAYDAAADRITPTAMEPVPREFRDPREFGDDWSEPLAADDVAGLGDYFRKFEHLRQKFQFINLRVGARFNNFDVALFANNVTDEKALLSLDRERGFRARIGFVTNQPRTFGVTTRVDF
jgi:outer membrane receptor protein involved in Fe transport